MGSSNRNDAAAFCSSPSDEKTPNRETLADRPEVCAEATEILKAIAHPIRLGIVAILVEEEANVGALADRLNSKQPIISQQLRILRMRRLVEPVRAGGYTVYRLAEPHLKVLVYCLQRCLKVEGARNE